MNGDIARFLSIVSLGKLGTNINMRMRRTCLNQSPRALTEKCERNTKGVRARVHFGLMTFEGDTSSTDPTNQQMIPPHHDYLSALFEKDAF